MERYLNITKPNPPTGKRKEVKHVPKKLTLKEHIMHVATTPSTSGHDIWQSASTGHQVSEAGAKSVTYNEARLAKLQAQFPPQQSRKRKHTANTSDQEEDAESTVVRDSGHIELFDYHAEDNTWYATPIKATAGGGSGIFSGCVFYLDGYMGSKMSDHTLRRVLTQNGGTLSLYLKKTRITHVLLSSKGALANSKIKKEVEGSRNRVKFVKVDWVHRCLELGKRIGEWEYSVDRLCGGNRTVASMFSTTNIAPTLPNNESESLAQPEEHLEGSPPLTESSQNADHLGAEDGERLDALDR